MDDAPQMPTGYPGMILLALIPPIWFQVMHRQMDRFGIIPS
jgi:alkane 1-monooxygenase